MVRITRFQLSESRFFVNFGFYELCEFENEVSLPPLIVGFYILNDCEFTLVNPVMVPWQVPFNFFKPYVLPYERIGHPANIPDRPFLSFEFSVKPGVRFPRFPVVADEHIDYLIYPPNVCFHILATVGEPACFRQVLCKRQNLLSYLIAASHRRFYGSHTPKRSDRLHPRFIELVPVAVYVQSDSDE